MQPCWRQIGGKPEAPGVHPAVSQKQSGGNGREQKAADQEAGSGNQKGARQPGRLLDAARRQPEAANQKKTSKMYQLF